MIVTGGTALLGPFEGGMIVTGDTALLGSFEVGAGGLLPRRAVFFLLTGEGIVASYAKVRAWSGRDFLRISLRVLPVFASSVLPQRYSADQRALFPSAPPLNARPPRAFWRSLSRILYKP